MSTFSLVICTLGRIPELNRCLTSIRDQGHEALQIIIVDQSGGEDVAALLTDLSLPGEVIHLRVPRVGTSEARNIGAAQATGEIITFPDDDCWYPAGVLALVQAILEKHPEFDGLTGRTIGEDGGKGNGRFAGDQTLVTVHNVWTTAIAFTIFLRMATWRSVGGFDPELGTGSKTPRQSGEDTDLVIRAIRAGARIWFTPELAIGHPRPTFDRPPSKVYYYGVGMGHVARAHRLPAKQTLGLLCRPYLGAVVFLLRGNLQAMRYHASIGAGRSVGYFGSRTAAAAGESAQ